MTNLIDHGYGSRRIRIDVHDNSLVETPPANPRNVPSQIPNQEAITIFSPRINNHPRMEEVSVEQVEQDSIVNEEYVLNSEVKERKNLLEIVSSVNDKAQEIFSLIIRGTFVGIVGSMYLGFWMGTGCFKITYFSLNSVATFIKEKVSAVYAKIRTAFSPQNREKIGKFLGSTIGKGIKHTLAMTGSASLGFLVGSRYPGATIAFSAGSLISMEIENRWAPALTGLIFLMGSYYPVTTIAFSAVSALAVMKIKNFMKSENKLFDGFAGLNIIYITATVVSHISPIGITTAVSGALGAMEGMWFVCKERRNILYFNQSLQYQTLQWGMSMLGRVIDTGFLIPLLSPTLLVYHRENIALLLSMGESFHNFQPPEGNSYDPAVIVNKVIEAIRQEQKRRRAIDRHERHLIGRISKSTVYTFVNSLNEYAQCIQHPDIQVRINALQNCPVTEVTERRRLQNLLIEQIVRRLSNVFTEQLMYGIQRWTQDKIRKFIGEIVRQVREHETAFVGFELSDLPQMEDLLTAHAICFVSLLSTRLLLEIGRSPRNLTDAEIHEFYKNLNQAFFVPYERYSSLKTVRNYIEALLPTLLLQHKQGAFVTHEITKLVSQQVKDNNFLQRLYDVEDFMENFWSIVRMEVVNHTPSRSTMIHFAAKGTRAVANWTVQTTAVLIVESVSPGFSNQLRSVPQYSREWFKLNIAGVALLIIKNMLRRR